MRILSDGLSRALRFTPSTRLSILLACAAPLWLLSAWPAGTVLASIVLLAILAAVVADVASLPSSDDVAVRRSLDESVGVGDVVVGSYTVLSRWGRALYVTPYDMLPAARLTTRGPYEEAVLPPNGEVRYEIHATGVTRGLAPLGDVALRVRTALGLVSRTLKYPHTDEILVAPSLAGVKRFRWLAVHHRLATVGVRDVRRRGEGRSFARLRDYVSGDDPRHIDWKATAKRGRPITREFTTEQAQTVFILVDAGRSMTQLAGRFPRFEYALSTTLLLADVAITAGDRIGALVFDDQLRALVPAQRGATALQALRTALVPVQASFVEPDYAAAFRALAQRQRKRALIVLVTDVIDARAAHALLANLTRGASRHLALVVALRNEALVTAAAVTGTRPSQLYASGAAEELVTERLTALQRMRDAGVVVLDVAPDAMAAAVVNQYLELKSRGAL
ncbi:MAG: DUF58 domain-containing protein [Gemmatimonadota bacterium]|nr:DUF58 domain-containing protein [Gemmatimonadota bacterium]